MKTTMDDAAGDVSLSGFKYSILFQLANGSNYGTGIKEDLMDYYGTNINHSRLYPNLNQLAFDGYINKEKLDNRSNNYSLTNRGRRAIADRIGWAIYQVYDDEAQAARIIRLIEHELDLG